MWLIVSRLLLPRKPPSGWLGGCGVITVSISVRHVAAVYTSEDSYPSVIAGLLCGRMSDALVGGLRWYHERLSVGERPAKSREALLRLATPLGDDSDDWKRTVLHHL